MRNYKITITSESMDFSYLHRICNLHHIQYFIFHIGYIEEKMSKMTARGYTIQTLYNSSWYLPDFK